MPTSRYGSDYGGWTVCPGALGCQPVVYSCGVGQDISFDLAMLDEFDAQVFAFDPTPGVSQWLSQQSLPDAFHYYPIGVGGVNGEAEFYAARDGNFSRSMYFGKDRTSVRMPIKTIGQLAADHGHDRIDLLKLDVEGAEYKVIQECLNSKLAINQILVEFHHRVDRGLVKETRLCLKKLVASGFRVASVSPTGNEYTLVHTSILS